MLVGVVLIFASAEMEESFKFFVSLCSKIYNDKKCNGYLNKSYDTMNLYFCSDRSVVRVNIYVCLNSGKFLLRFFSFLFLQR